MATSILQLENYSREELLKDLRLIIAEELARQSQPETTKEYLTRYQVKDLLNSSLPTVDRLTRDGVLKGYRFGRKVLFKSEEVNSSLEEIQALKYRHS